MFVKRQASLQVEFTNKQRAEICAQLLRLLPRWFGIEESIVKYVEEAETMPMIVAREGNQVVGFLTLRAHDPQTFEIHVMAVHPEYHRRGAGRSLVKFAEEYARSKHAKFLTVKTISASSPNKEYAQTRRFYESVGFAPREEIKGLWGEHNPCLVMAKSLEFQEFT